MEQDQNLLYIFSHDYDRWKFELNYRIHQNTFEINYVISRFQKSS